MTMRVAVIGAGVAGLATAKVLTQAGHVVRVYDRTPDVGGVWSATRRYPGLTTQSPKAQYALSDFPMPDDYPEWPTGEQVQRWLGHHSPSFTLDTYVHLLDGDIGTPLEPLRVHAGYTQRPETAANGTAPEPAEVAA